MDLLVHVSVVQRYWIWASTWIVCRNCGIKLEDIFSFCILWKSWHTLLGGLKLHYYYYCCTKNKSECIM